MSSNLHRWFVPLAATAMLLVGATPAVAGVVDPAPIAPNQYFVGLVNGQHGQSRIDVTCDGPIDIVATGHPIAGQTVGVLPASAAPNSAVGFTGIVARQIGVGFSPARPSTPQVSLRFYGTIAQIPTSTVVPCSGSGSGSVTFEPNPTSPTAHASTVTLTFVSRS